MAVWYCSYGNGTSTGYYAVAQWAALTTYSVGNIVRQLAAPAVGSERCFRASSITTGISGAAEPTWSITKGATTTDAGVTWTEVTGNSTYNWTAPFARLQTACKSGFPAAGDTIYVASIHAETQSSSSMTIATVGSPTSPLNIQCVTASGSVPPVSADIRSSATCATTGANALTVTGTCQFSGVSFSSGQSIAFDSGGSHQKYSNCGMAVAAGSNFVDLTRNGSMVWSNVTFNSGDTGGYMSTGLTQLTWLNTPSALVTNVSTTLFQSSGGGVSITCDGIDFSAAGSGKTLVGAHGSPGSISFLNCEFGASSTVSATPSQRGFFTSVQISDSAATQYRQELYVYEGTLTTETTFFRSGGASDGTTPISWKVVSTAKPTWAFPFYTPPIAIWNNATGVSKTATVEIENGGVTLTNAQVWLEVEYLGSSSFPLSSAVSSGTADILATGSSIPTSSVTWNGGLGSAVKQYLQVTFTPQMVGYVRARVAVAVASQTLYIDPVITIA